MGADPGPDPGPEPELRIPARPPAAADADAPHLYTLQSSRLRTAPKLCRDFVAGVLRSIGQDHLIDTAMLCTSELATNSYLHAEGETVLLRVLVQPPLLRVGMYDGCPARPTTASIPDSAERYGRGLGLVEALADNWGTTDADPLGWYAKAVWFELKTAAAPGFRQR
jgi:anti-sigma regulatory factor (Ser/Thr protein kinase)